MTKVNEVTEKTMTTREVADALGTSVKVIIENARKCLPNKIIENGKATYWTEPECSAKSNSSSKSFISLSHLAHLITFSQQLFGITKIALQFWHLYILFSFIIFLHKCMYFVTIH